MNQAQVIGTLKQIMAIVSVFGGTVLMLKIFGANLSQIPGFQASIMDWAAVTVATSLASK